MRTFSARETEWLQELDGIELANFWQRALAFLLDWTFITIIFSLIATLGVAGYLGVRRLQGRPVSVSQMIEENGGQYHFELGPGGGFGNDAEKAKEPLRKEALHLFSKIIVPVLYFGVLLWTGKGRTPGKRILKIRVVSLMHRHITFWHAVERALGYGAAALELGFGFVQFFIHPYRRCAQDRLAETIVVTERSYRTMQHKFSHPLLPDA